MELQQRINEVLEYMNYFIDVLAYRTKTHYRVIDTNKPKIKFPVNHHLGNELIEWDMTNGNYGWGKPDAVIGNIELRYLWKNEKILNFEEWQRINHQ